MAQTVQSCDCTIWFTGPAFHHEQPLQSFLLLYVHCPLAPRDPGGSHGNEAQSPVFLHSCQHLSLCHHFQSLCAGGQHPPRLHDQAGDTDGGLLPSQLTVLEQDLKSSGLLLTSPLCGPHEFSCLLSAHSPQWKPGHKPGEGRIPPPRPRTFTTIGLNRDGRVQTSPGTTLCLTGRLFVSRSAFSVPGPSPWGLRCQASAHPVE